MAWLLSWRHCAIQSEPNVLPKVVAERELEPKWLPTPPKDARERGPRPVATAPKRSLKPTVLPHAEELKRRVLVALNKICPENLDTIVRQLQDLKPKDAEELECIVTTLFAKALHDPHYCETYADAVHGLCACYPEFPPEEGGKPVTFRRVLVTAVQNAFESLTASLAEVNLADGYPEEAESELRKRRASLVANMKFIGHLFLRELLPLRVIGVVMQDLLRVGEGSVGLSHEYGAECACELLQAVGHTLEHKPAGRALVVQVVGRLTELRNGVDADGKHILSGWTRCKVQDVIELRKQGWSKKLLREEAKPLADVRTEAQERARGGAAAFGKTLAGAKPACIAAAEAAARPALDKAGVLRLLQYFAGDRDVESLERDWRQAQGGEEAEGGLARLLEAGCEDAQRAGPSVEAAAELVLRGAVSWQVLGEALTAIAENLQELQLDAPHAPGMVSSLLVKLLTGVPTGRGGGTGGGGLAAALRPLAAAGQRGRTVLREALRQVGPGVIEELLASRTFAAAASTVEGCGRDALRGLWQRLGLLG